jgi:4-amino-4-deoxy-L-arabinose transferase-like glycosyltransferase
VTSSFAVSNPAASNIVASPAARRWRASSLILIALPWLILYLGGIFSPGLLDDVDSVYIEIAREMLLRHNFVTPYIDGIRFFDKPPLMYWLAAGSMHLFGVHDWAARLPLALGVLALLFATYALGIRLFAGISPAHAPDRAGLYAALAMALSIGPFLYTRFYIPDILVGLWMTLSVHCFLIALERANARVRAITPAARISKHPVILSEASHRDAQSKDPGNPRLATTADTFSTTNVRALSPLLPMLGFAATVALNVLTKGFIGLVFPFAFVLLYLLCTRELHLLAKLKPLASTLVFLAIAAPWHILAALRNPPIAMPRGLGLPAHAGWAWFYLYNEHIARFLGRRIPHDYGQVPIPIFWLLLLLWLLPWTAFLPSAVLGAIKQLRSHAATYLRLHEASLALLLWAGIILGFFTLSSRQEYYHLPALPALALLVGGLLAAADRNLSAPATDPIAAPFDHDARRRVLRASLFFLVPLGAALFLLCGYLALTSPAPRPGITLNDLLNSNHALYNLSLGHLFDLSGNAMSFFRRPLAVVAVSMLLLGPASHLLRRSAAADKGPAADKQRRTFAANLLVAAAMTGVLLAAHQGYVRFNPILGSKDLALAINAARRPGDLIAIDGELTSGSTLLFYTRQPVLLVNGRENGPWFGSFYPDAPHIFLSNADLARLWSGSHRVFLLTYHAQQRTHDLAPLGPVVSLASSGGKTILTNRK